MLKHPVVMRNKPANRNNCNVNGEKSCNIPIIVRSQTKRSFIDVLVLLIQGFFIINSIIPINANRKIIFLIS